MAGSLMERLRARIEELQEELKPEAGFDRRAYGYDDDAGGEDATFGDIDRGEEESPWRRPGSGPPEPEPRPGPAAGSEGVTEAAPPRAAHEPRRATARPEAFDPFGVRRGQAVSGLRRDTPSPPSPAAQAAERSPGSPAAGVHPASRDAERTGPRGTTRGTTRRRRLRARLRQPESLRDLFLLREVIDRPVALRRRPRR